MPTPATGTGGAASDRDVARAAAAPILVEEFLVASEAHVRLYVRNKRPADLAAFSPGRTVLFVHGATYPAQSAFDLPLDGMSWMDYIAARGYDVYLFDLRGYGGSTRPPQMDRPAAENPPFAGTEEAMRDLDAVLEFIRTRRAVERVCLIAWSWGTAIAQWYTSLNNHKVEKLALYAPLWIRRTPSLVAGGAGPLPAYRCVTMAQARSRWLGGVPEGKGADLIPAGWFEAWAAATLATDPVGAACDPPVLRAPNGVVADGLRYWGAGVIPWKPEDIRVPVLLANPEWDQDTPGYMARELLPRLSGAPHARLVEIREGTHTVIMERNRMELFVAVQEFLDGNHQGAG